MERGRIRHPGGGTSKETGEQAVHTRGQPEQHLVGLVTLWIIEERGLLCTQALPKLIDGNEEALRRTTEEATRWATPTSHFMRHARKDARLGGEQIRAGDVVTVWLASADRDGAAFPDPDTFDVHREKNAHFGYGHGTHYCSGAPIARTSITIALREIAARTERIEVAGPVTRVRSNFVHGYGSAWLSCTPRRDRRPA